MTARVGETGRTATQLRPSGKVVIGGRTHPARSATGDLLEPGVDVVVVGGDAFGLLVRPAADFAGREVPDSGRTVLSRQQVRELRAGEEQQMLREQEKLARAHNLSTLITNTVAGVACGVPVAVLVYPSVGVAWSLLAFFGVLFVVFTFRTLL